MFENVLQRQFEVGAPNRTWVSDVTYVRTAQGWLYLAVVLDLYSRRMVGWASASTTRVSLVYQALEMAIRRRHPEPGLLLHSDRGVQYTSAQYQALLNQHGIRCSMSRKGDCYFYNVQRLHSTLGYLAPADYEADQARKPPKQVSTKT